jgi:hypothetical protein
MIERSLVVKVQQRGLATLAATCFILHILKNTTPTALSFDSLLNSGGVGERLKDKKGQHIAVRPIY